MSKLERIHTFIQIVEENSFAGCARKLGVSTAAISRQLNALEAELGVQLLTRTTRHLALTEIGLQYYQQCKKTVAELMSAEEAIAGSQCEASGILTLIANRYFANTLLIPHLASFLSQHPKLRIKLELAERFPNFSQENIDILFGVTLEGPPELVRKRLSSTQYILCASPAYLQQYGTPLLPADLVSHRYIAHSMRQPMDTLHFNDGKELYLQPFLWLNDIQAMKNCALQGMGIIKIHDYEVKAALQNGTLVELLPAFKSPPQAVYLYYQQSRYLQPKIRRFIDFYTSL